MTPCACGQITPSTDITDPAHVELYIRHVQEKAHQQWRKRVVAPEHDYPTLLGRPPMYDCQCGTIHWTDTRIGQHHWALGWSAATLTLEPPAPTSVSANGRAA